MHTIPLELDKTGNTVPYSDITYETDGHVGIITLKRFRRLTPLVDRADSAF